MKRRAVGARWVRRWRLNPQLHRGQPDRMDQCQPRQRKIVECKPAAPKMSVAADAIDAGSGCERGRGGMIGRFRSSHITDPTAWIPRPRCQSLSARPSRDDWKEHSSGSVKRPASGQSPPAWPDRSERQDAINQFSSPSAIL